MSFSVVVFPVCLLAEDLIILVQVWLIVKKYFGLFFFLVSEGHHGDG